MGTTALLCVLLLLLLSPGLASAQDPAYDRSGVYIGVGGIRAYEDFDDDGLGLRFQDTFGFDARIGYRLHPRLAAEAQYQWYDEFDVKFSGTEIGTIDGWSLTGNLKGFLLTGQYQPYVLSGAGLLSLDLDISLADDDDTAFAWRLGFGIDAYTYATPAGDNLVLNVEASYVIPTNDLDDLDFWTVGIGLAYRF
jgi:opacity protein-like surface antigen